MKNKTKPAPTVIPHRWTAEEFRQKYEELCKESGFQIAYEPRWVKSLDNNDYRLVIASGVIPVPKSE